MDWYAYDVSPIDFGWGNLKTVEDTIAEIAASEAAAKIRGVDMKLYAAMEEDPTTEDFFQAWESALQAAEEKGWEGDFRHRPVVFWVPTSTAFQYGFAFKQDNNGVTFVISPVPMPWLEDA